MVYFDVDGVIADFRTAYTDLTGHVWQTHPSEWEDLDHMWQLPLEGLIHMYRSMPLLPDGKLFLDAVRDKGWALLTAVPQTPPHLRMARLKWLRELGYGDVRCIFAEDKTAFARGPNILVDDREDTLLAWEEAGGNCIWYWAGDDGPIEGTEVLDMIAFFERR